MLLYSLLICGFCVFYSSAIYNNNPGPKYPPTKGEVWPKPQYQKSERYYFTVNTSAFKIKATNHTCPILAKAIERYSFIMRNTFNLDLNRKPKTSRHRLPRETNSEDPYYQGLLKELDIELISPCEEYPYFNMDESYELTISTTAKLLSSSIWGILRGLESWSHLLYLTDDKDGVSIDICVNRTHIADFPRYAHRGLLLDTGRHFISMSNILKTLDAMAMNKLNVFHWHIVDDQSFPYQSEKFPDLSGKGAFDPSLVYTKDNIATVLQYATERGIRVLPEFDVPGHTRSWGEAFPNVLTECFSDGKVVGLGPMNPTVNTTYKLFQELMEEVQEWFPDKYFHIGGDEVQFDCWESNPDLQQYMKDHHMTATQLHALFMKNVIPLLGNNTKPIVWQEVFDVGVPLSSDTIIHVWKNGWVEEMVKILKAGHRLIFSASWYLDHLKTGGDWEDMYMADPRLMVNLVDDTASLDNIVGGEACMWGEVVDDTNVINRVWPRTSAAAERLWSAGLASNSLERNVRLSILDKARHRIEEHACRMRRRAINAQPPNGPGFCVGAKLF
ncbi:beta-hexosaminidase subunit alpha-like isoform X1 [Ostrinia nubilalis]|uniref:beta-hexosaminidase subunit alpha-like isoform X1 n=1 Tax=Ostrinia nubilalis TaxID=29057 RepID=UPI0030825AEF